MTNIIDFIRSFYLYSNKEKFISSLKSKGIIISSDVHFYGNLRNVSIDTNRPSLVKIGKKVRIVSPFTLLCHGREWGVLLEKYGELIGSSGPVTIGNNVYIGRDVMILPNVNIGDNVIIGARSLITKNIPSDTVVAGSPAKKIYNLEDYYQIRKERMIDDAKVYARSIFYNQRRIPREEDFQEFFTLFLPRSLSSIDKFNKKIRKRLLSMGKPANKPIVRACVQYQLGDKFNNFLSSKPVYGSFSLFLEDCELPLDEIK